MSPRILKRVLCQESPVTVGNSEEAVTKKREETEAVRAGVEQEIRNALRAEMSATLESERRKIKDDVDRRAKEIVSELEPRLVALVLDAVKKICLSDADKDGEQAMRWIREGIKLLGGKPGTVRVSPKTAESLPGLRDEIAPHALDIDKSLSAGDVLVQDGPSVWDARLSTRIEEVRRTFERMPEKGQ